MQIRAFTLIELLIVVAIIAILAAIAVPNFLEAQVRAKVSRVHSDLRTIATAAEIFAVDNGHYPSSVYEMTGGMLTSVPLDPFPWKSSTSPTTKNPYIYQSFGNSPTVLDQACLAAAGRWATYSVGPDGDIQNTPPGQSNDPIRIYRDYDPTNGTISPGNIFRTHARPNSFGVHPYFYTIP